MAFSVAKQTFICFNHSWLLFSEVFSVEGGFLLTQFEAWCLQCSLYVLLRLCCRNSLPINYLMFLSTGFVRSAVKT